MNDFIYLFKDLVDDLRCGREIEFRFKNKSYSITNTNYSIGSTGNPEDVNKNPHWQFDNNTEKTNKIICGIKENDILIDYVNNLIIENLSLKDIFDKNLYTELYIM